MASLNIEIITPYRTSFTGEAESITIPGTEGSFQVLKNHAPLIATFDIGIIKIKIAQEKVLYFATAGGTVEVNDNKVLVLASAFEAIEEIDLERARLALEKARKRIQEKDSKTDLQRAELALKRAQNRINVVEKYLPRDKSVKH